MSHFSQRIPVIKKRMTVKRPLRFAPSFISGGTNQMLGRSSWPAPERHFDSFCKFWFSFLRVVHQIWYTFLCTLWHHKYDALRRHCCWLVMIESEWTAGVSCHWLRMCRDISRHADRSTVTVWCTAGTSNMRPSASTPAARTKDTVIWSFNGQNCSFYTIMYKTPTHALYVQHYIILTCWFH